MNSRFRAVAVVLLVWTLIYLPALGSIAIRGEEGRRILPAIRMLETGNYIVPETGSNPDHRKPPLVNWLVAGSFKIFGARNEWIARLPSVLAVLAVAVAFVTVARASLGPRGSIIAALIWMTNIGMIEKGRLIEIEALYVSLCGLAIIFWLSFWGQINLRGSFGSRHLFFLGLVCWQRAQHTWYFSMRSSWQSSVRRKIGGCFFILRTLLRLPSCLGSGRHGPFRFCIGRRCT